MMIYEKPKMEFIGLQANQAIANGCFPAAKLNDTLCYFNSSGYGYLQLVCSAKMNGTTCGKDGTYLVTYYDVAPEKQTAALEELQRELPLTASNFNPSGKFAENPTSGWS